MRFVALLFSSLVLISCASTQPPSSTVVDGSMAGVNYKYRSRTYFMGQPTAATFGAAKLEGVTTVINLRAPEEMKGMDFDPKKLAQDAGLTYYNVPMASGQPISKTTLAEIESIYMKHHKNGEKVIVQCASGQRAAAWFAYHLKTQHGDKVSTAIEKAKELGLSRPDLIESLEKTLAD